MSRCFPFPPPGYDKKTRNDEVDFLIKDKHKEKKHKKEKRDKDKEGKDKDREKSKDKKDKERSKDKDREKRDRKEKHKERKSKDRQETDEKKTDGQAESSNGRKHCENNLQADIVKVPKVGETSRRIADEERGRRDQMVEKPAASDQRNVDGVSLLVDKYFDNKIEERETSKDNEGLDKRLDRQILKDAGGAVRNTMVPSTTEIEHRRVGGTSKPMEKDIERKLESKAKTVGPSVTGTEQRRVGGCSLPMERDIERKLEAKGRTEQYRAGGSTLPIEKDIERKLEAKGKTVAPGFNGTEQIRLGGSALPMEKDVEGKLDAKGKTVGPSITGTEQGRVGGSSTPMEELEAKGKNKEKKEKGKEKEKDKDKDKKRKHRDGEKKSKEKKSSDKERGKDKVKHESKKQKKTIEVPKDYTNTLSIKPIQIPKENERSCVEENSIKPIQIPPIGTEKRGGDGILMKPLQVPKATEKSITEPIQLGEKSVGVEENSKKRKCETNGFFHENDAQLSKVVRPTLSSSSSHPSLTLSMNGRKPEVPQPASPFASASTLPGRTLRFDNKVLKVNGLIQPQPQPQPSSITSPVPQQQASTRAENGEGEAKPKPKKPPPPPPPHPDSKYLNQILSVPKVEDWSDFDDQEWLFSSSEVNVNPPKAVSSGVDGPSQVWDRALRIDSADVCALPYVIPY